MSQSHHDEQLLAWAVECLELEVASINEAKQRLGSEFSEAVRSILACRGKVVVTGLGKSGHIATKIAATFASTGTPSFFLHPAEALHGDLGMVGRDDCLLAVAYGGETMEVINVAKFCRRFSIPVIAITGKPTSSLAQLASIVIDGSVSREACPHNLAPTSSSVLAMALGDALAMTLMQARGFQVDDFASYHPAGSLGRRLALVKDYLRTDGQLSVDVTTEFDGVLEAITSQNHGIVAVAADGGIVGAISDGDIRRCLRAKKAQALSLKAADMMSQRPKVIFEQDLAIDACRVMEASKITSLFVVNKNSPSALVGLVKLGDLLEAGLGF